MLSGHAEQRIQNALDALSGEFSGHIEIGEKSTLRGVGIGTPEGCYPLTITLDAPYGTKEYSAERADAARLMRDIGWHEVGLPDPAPDDVSRIVLNVKPEVVQRLIDAGIEIKGKEHFSTEPAAAAGRQ